MFTCHCIVIPANQPGVFLVLSVTHAYNRDGSLLNVAFGCKDKTLVSEKHKRL